LFFTITVQNFKEDKSAILGSAPRVQCVQDDVRFGDAKGQIKKTGGYGERTKTAAQNRNAAVDGDDDQSVLGRQQPNAAP